MKKNAKVADIYGYVKKKRSEKKIDWVIELVERFNKIQEMRHERRKNNV